MRRILALLCSVVPVTAFAAAGGLSVVGSVTLPPHELATRGTFSADGAHAYLALTTVIAGARHEGVAAFARDGVTGGLTPIGTVIDDETTIEGLDSPSAIAVSPDGAHLYVTSFDVRRSRRRRPRP
jgi:hypothetical protein